MRKEHRCSGGRGSRFWYNSPPARGGEKIGFLQGQTNWETPFQSLSEEYKGLEWDHPAFGAKGEMCSWDTEKGSKAIPFPSLEVPHLRGQAGLREFILENNSRNISSKCVMAQQVDTKSLGFFFFFAFVSLAWGDISPNNIAKTDDVKEHTAYVFS